MIERIYQLEMEKDSDSDFIKGHGEYSDVYQ